MMWRSRRTRVRDEALHRALGDRLRDMAEMVEPTPEFRSSLRTSLMNEASTVLIPGPPGSALPAAQAAGWQQRRRMVVATALIAGSLGLGGVTSASATALPGEALYPVKRAAEQVELTFQRSRADRGAFHLELAERRLYEARQLSQGGPEFADLATESIREFEVAAAAGTADLMAAFRQDNDRSSMLVLNGFTERTDDLLASLAPLLPAEGAAALDNARDRLETIETRSEELCPTCGGGSDEGPSSPGASDDSIDAAPEPEPAPDPEPEPDAPPPAPSVTGPSEDFSDDSDDQEESEEDEEAADDADDSADEQLSEPERPAPAPDPTPTPDPMPTPAPDATPTPDPAPAPTDPPPGLLDIVPGTVEGLGEALGGTLDVLF